MLYNKVTFADAIKSCSQESQAIGIIHANPRYNHNCFLLVFKIRDRQREVYDLNVKMSLKVDILKASFPNW